MTDAEVREALATARVARLATVGPHGRPHLVPICLAVDGDRIYTAVDHKPKRTGRLQRIANISSRPEVSVLVDHYDDDRWESLWWVRVDGRARLVAPETADHGRGRRLLAGRYPQYRERPPAAEMIVIEIERIAAWSGSGAIPSR